MAENDQLKCTSGAQSPGAMTDNDHGSVTGASSIIPGEFTSIDSQPAHLSDSNGNGNHDTTDGNLNLPVTSEVGADTVI